MAAWIACVRSLSIELRGQELLNLPSRTWKSKLLNAGTMVYACYSGRWWKAMRPCLKSKPQTNKVAEWTQHRWARVQACCSHLSDQNNVWVWIPFTDKELQWFQFKGIYTDTRFYSRLQLRHHHVYSQDAVHCVAMSWKTTASVASSSEGSETLGTSTAKPGEVCVKRFDNLKWCYELVWCSVHTNYLPRWEVDWDSSFSCPEKW